MYHIEILNTRYDTDTDLYQLLRYIYFPAKVYEDTIRPICNSKVCTGCEPFLFPRSLEHDAGYVHLLMSLNNQIYSYDRGDLAKHRIISFSPDDYVFPADLDSLGRAVINYYASHGYIASYAVHKDTPHVHLHVVVDAYRYTDGNRFSLYFELQDLCGIVARWYASHIDRIERSPRLKARYEKVLFGDSLRYESVPLSAAEQIAMNRKAQCDR